MIKFKEWSYSSLDETVFIESNLAFTIEFEGQTVPFYNYKDGRYISPCSPSGMDEPMAYGMDMTSRRLLKAVNDKLIGNINKAGEHYRLVGYYTSEYQICKSKNSCRNCANTYAFGTSWDIRCSKQRKEGYGHPMISQCKLCEDYSYFKE